MTDASKSNGKADSAQVQYNQIRQDLLKRKPLLAGHLAGDPDVLERVRDYERQATQVAQQLGLVAAKGEDIERLALLDPLTELYNHRVFVKELQAEMVRATRYAQKLSICMLTVDDYDSIAETYGSLTQDAVLKVVANVIRSCVREVDVSARYAPYQFGIILPQTNSAGAALIAERIRSKIASQVFAHNWQNFSTTASGGIGTYPVHGQLYDEIIAHAIEAMETAMDRGGDRIFTF
ncbi:MAG: GGDEF domain-containing protein [Candidatus Obscuribacterales bacterium]|nr:GGDEF domain-containing protein [Candidatus Obscuribacterales bacterium]